MHYEYRNLTYEQQEEILHQRREKNYPLHAPPHPFRDEGYYLITAANYEHQPIMNTPERRTDFEKRLLAAMQEIQADIVGWVILTNHYHFLVGVESLEHVSSALKQLHGITSREWNLADGQTGKRRVWYKFADRMIRNEAHYYRALNYIHSNPLKHGCVSDIYVWTWSSLILYYEDLGREWLSEKWCAFPPGDFGKGWDD